MLKLENYPQNQVNVIRNRLRVILQNDVDVSLPCVTRYVSRIVVAACNSQRYAGAAGKVGNIFSVSLIPVTVFGE
jgi:hypothetical protein